MAAPAGVVLGIGATGILRPAVASLLARDAPVVAVARDATALAAVAGATGANVTVRAVDARDAAALARSLVGLRVNGAIAYDPAVSADSWTVLARLVEGPVVQVVTSSAADPSRPRHAPPPYPFTRLVLGWTAQGRWHTPAEVSAAAVAVLTQAELNPTRSAWAHAQNDAVLGRVRPWSERPRH